MLKIPKGMSKKETLAAGGESVADCFGVKVVDPSPPSDTVIRQLEKALEDAKAGKLVAFAATYQWNDGGVTNGWAMDHRNTQRFRMVGSMFQMMGDLTMADGEIADRLVWDD